MENLFIDTNIYLSFFHFSSDDLEELRKLSVAVESKRIRLYLTTQVVDEFRRNRGEKIADALKKFDSQNLPRQFPEICKSYAEYSKLRKLAAAFDDFKKILIENLKNDIQERSLLADEIIDKLFSVADKLEVTDTIIEDARTRIECGNPPGKKGALGDAINWELLLKTVPIDEDLHLITDDKDYSSKIDRSQPSEFLLWEWNNKKNSKLFYYLRLSDYLGVQFSDIKLASELEKRLAISDLVNSESFSQTHIAIKKLSKFTNFEDSEIQEIVEASVSNRQIYWIYDDKDVHKFLLNLIHNKEDIIEPEQFSKFKSIYIDQGSTSTGIITEVNDDLPF